jgi:hypothetical protein
MTWAPPPPCALRPGLPTSSTSTLSTKRYEPGSPTRATSSAIGFPNRRERFPGELGSRSRRRVVEECVAAVAALGGAFDPGVVLLAAHT